MDFAQATIEQEKKEALKYHYNTWQLDMNQVNSYAWYDNVFTDEEIEDICKYGDLEYEKTQAQVGGGGTGEVNQEIRKTTITWIPINDETSWVFRKLTDVIQAANNQWFQFALNQIESLQYSVYNEGDFYERHTDHHFQGPGQYCRKLSFVMQLTDPSEYEGCKTNIITQKEPWHLEQKKGVISFFPSYCLHEVEALTKGQRKALVGWVAGPKWK